MNTPALSKSSTTPSKKDLGQPGAAPQHKLEMVGYRDQYGGSKVKLTGRHGQCFFDAAEITCKPQVALKRAAEVGHILTRSSSKNDFLAKIEDLTFDHQCLCAKQPGFIFDEGKPPRAIVHVDAGGGIQKPNTVLSEVVVEFERNFKVCRKGNRDEYIATMGKFTKGQAIPMFLLLYSLTPLILPFVPPSHYVENTLLELFGASTSAKSALATTVAGSVWGGSSHKTHFFDDWNATINSIEAKMPNFNLTLMGLDESTQQEGDAAARRNHVVHLIHRLSSGHEKERLNQEKGKTFRIMAISTANDGTTEDLQESQAVADGIGVRYLGIKVPKRKTGFFDKLPEGVDTPQTAIEELHSLVTDNFGHLARRFAKEILRSQKKDVDQLRIAIAKHMNHFLSKNGIKKSNSYAYRHLKPVALAYAAGRIAKDFGVLPQENFGNFLEPLSQALVHVNQKPPSQPRQDALDFFLAYARKNRQKLIEVTRKKSLVLSDDEFNKCPGFLGKLRDGRAYLAIPISQMGKGDLEGYDTHLQAMKRKGMLIHDLGGLQTKTRVRRTIKSNKKCSNDRFYKLLIPNLHLD